MNHKENHSGIKQKMVASVYQKNLISINKEVVMQEPRTILRRADAPRIFTHAMQVNIIIIVLTVYSMYNARFCCHQK